MPPPYKAPPCAPALTARSAVPRRSPVGVALWPPCRCWRRWPTPSGGSSACWRPGDVAERHATDFAGASAKPRSCRARISAQRLPAGAVHQGSRPSSRRSRSRSSRIVLARCGDNALVLALDQVTDPHNVGAILRSAAAFGAGRRHRHRAPRARRHRRAGQGRLGCAGDRAAGARGQPRPHARPAARKRASGSTASTRAATSAIGDLDLGGRACIVLGAEGEGLRRLTAEKCDRLVTIPTEAKLASLNVSNAAAVAAYEWKRRRAS